MGGMAPWHAWFLAPGMRAATAAWVVWQGGKLGSWYQECKQPQRYGWYRTVAHLAPGTRKESSHSTMGAMVLWQAWSLAPRMNVATAGLVVWHGGKLGPWHQA
jgi:hypothetical protein